MSETHTSYKVSKRLKEFLGESAPEPMDKGVWIRGRTKPVFPPYAFVTGEALYPAYQLHDLLSKPFCEALENIGVRLFSHTIVLRLSNMYYDGGLPAVEKALCEMMGEEAK